MSVEEVCRVLAPVPVRGLGSLTTALEKMYGKDLTFSIEGGWMIIVRPTAQAP